jgi:DNA replication and repair protein RecF
MKVLSLSITNFKNIREMFLTPSPKLTCFAGSNGAGKTNLLDALYMLSMCKSSGWITDKECITHGENFFVLKGTYQKQDAQEVITCGVSSEGIKTIRRGDKAYKKITEHLGLLPLVMVAPSDASLISDSGEARRRFLNSVLVQTQSTYIEAINNYNNALMQRNKLLKTYRETQADILDALDAQLCRYGSEVYMQRLTLTQAMQEPFARYYQAIAGEAESAEVRYNSYMRNGDYAVLLARSRRKDIALQYTTTGVHRDDLEFLICMHGARRLGSQGQQKTCLLALKLAQADALRSTLGLAPILLLDDIFDKLDADRIHNLMHLLAAENFGQIFLTDSSRERIEKLLHTLPYESQLHQIQSGALIE